MSCDAREEARDKSAIARAFVAAEISSIKRLSPRYQRLCDCPLLAKILSIQSPMHQGKHAAVSVLMQTATLPKKSTGK